MSVECPSCQADNPAESRFCARCGTELPIRCTRCGSHVPAGARFCATCGQPLQAEPAPEERKLATAVFVDLVDSTAIGEGLDPERLRSLLQDYFSVVSTTVQAWGGTLEKYIGDAVVALFGVPRVREDDAARAVSAAAEIVERIRDLAIIIAKDYGVALAVRVGVNTGEVMAPTEVRPDQPMVTGDAINVAARLQTSAEPGRVLVGDRTFRSTQSLFRFGDPVELTLKGKAAPVTAHPLVGRIEGALEAGPARNVQARVVGRERELSLLGALLDEAVESRTPRLAVVYGPAGIGKSRLVREALALAASERPDLTILRGRCPAVGQSITYWPLAEVVRAAAGISLDDGGAEATEKLRRTVTDLLVSSGASESEAEATMFALATTAGIAIADNPLDRSRPIGVVTELARRWPLFLSALAARQPTVVLIEDLHWASDQVIQMVERLLSRSIGPLLLVATARPEFAEAYPGFAAGRSEALTVSLRPLNRGQTTSLLAGLLPTGNLPVAIRDQILETAEGNPLFIEEIVSRLIEMGALNAAAGGAPEAGRQAAAVVIPDTIQSLLSARIDALPEVERRVLREAAVVGRIFWDEPVAVAAGMDADLISAPFGELERRGLISMRPTSTLAGHAEYTFKHALIRDVAYGGLSIAGRTRAHAAVAVWLAGLSPDRPEELAELVAFHYLAALGEGVDLAWSATSAELAEVKRRARAAFVLAGETARKRFSIDSAVDFHQRALDLATTDEERATALEALGDDHDANYDGDKSVPAWDAAMTAASTLKDRDQRVARMSMKVARMGAIRWGGFSVPMEPEVLDRYVDAGLAVSAESDTHARLLLMRAAVGLRWVAFHRVDPIPLEDRVKAGEEARIKGQEIGDVALEASALRSVGALLIARGEVARGTELTRPLLDLIPRIDDPRERHLMMMETTQTLMWIAGEAESLIPLLMDTLRLGRELRAHDLCHSTAVLISALYLSGRWDEIPGYLDEHIRTFKLDEADTTCPFALGAFQLGATVLAHRGEADRAREVAADMPKSEAPVGIIVALQAMAANSFGEAETGRRLAEEVLSTGTRNFAEEPAVEIIALFDALLALGDWKGVRAFLPEARRRSAELALAGPAADRAEGLAAAAAGDRAGGAKLLEQAVRGFDPVSPFEAARAREDLAALDEKRGPDLRHEALATYERLGAKPHAARVRAALAETEDAVMHANHDPD